MRRTEDGDYVQNSDEEMIDDHEIGDEKVLFFDEELEYEGESDIDDNMDVDNDDIKPKDVKFSFIVDSDDENVENRKRKKYGGRKDLKRKPKKLKQRKVVHLGDIQKAKADINKKLQEKSLPTHPYVVIQNEIEKNYPRKADINKKLQEKSLPTHPDVVIQNEIEKNYPRKIVILDGFTRNDGLSCDDDLMKLEINIKYYDIGDLIRHLACGGRKFGKQSKGSCCNNEKLIPKYVHPVEMVPENIVAGEKKKYGWNFDIDFTKFDKILDENEKKRKIEQVKKRRKLLLELFEIYNSKEFNEFSRELNYLFSMSTLLTKPNKKNKGKGLHYRGWPSNVIVHGSTFSLCYPINKKQTQRGNGNYFHAIIHDKNSEQLNKKLEDPKVRNLYFRINNILKQINPLYLQYKQLVDANNEFNNTNKIMCIKWDVQEYVDKKNRMFAVPFEKKEVGIILKDKLEKGDKMKLLVYPINNNPGGFGEEVSMFRRCADAIQFPLFFPLSEASWGSEGRERYYAIDKITGEEIKDKKHEVTIREYYSTRFCMEDIFTFGGRLFNEFICNAYSKIRQKRMNEFKDPKWQSKVYRKFELFEDVNARKNGSFTPGRVYVPGSYTGGVRYKKKKYNNFLELQYKDGPSSVFLTFTTNTGWPEIKRNIHSWQVAADRPDVAVCAYYLKQQELIRDIRSGSIFGKKSQYFSNSVEWQKKGHVHCHMLIRFQGAQPQTAEEIDSIIMARAPEKREKDPKDDIWKPVIDPKTGLTIIDTESKLFKLAIGEKNPRTGRYNGFQIHHHSIKHCGVSPEDTTTICKRGFPKPLCEETYIDEKTGICYFKRIHWIDRWVVSFVPSITLKYQTHHNGDIVNTKDPKYCFKYNFKSEEERAKITIAAGKSKFEEESIDETKIEMEGLYVSASESFYRIKGFGVCQIEPAIDVIFLHLDHNAPVYKRIKVKKRLKDLKKTCKTREEYEKLQKKLEEDLKEARETLEKNPIDVVRYFKRPKPNKEHYPKDWLFFEELKYIEYKEIFLTAKSGSTIGQKDLKDKFLGCSGELSLQEKVNSIDGLWIDTCEPPATPHFLFKRKDGNIKYYRIQTMYPSKGELFFFRILILNKPARSYDDLLTVKTKNKDTGKIIKQVLYESFQEACIAEGLFSDKNEYYYTMNEIVQRLYVPSDLRNTFCYLIQEEGCPARTLFKQFASYMVEDWEFKPQRDNPDENNPNFKLGDNSTIRRESIVKLLLFIQDKLSRTSCKMRDLGFPDIIDPTGVIEKELKKFSQIKDKIWDEFLEKIKLSNIQQRCLIMLIIAKVLLKKSYRLFVNSKAGRGKTFWIIVVALFLRFYDILCELWATTGKGSLQFPFGKTFHKGGGVPFKKENEPVVNCNLTKERASILKATGLFVVDEVTIAHEKNIDAFDRKLKEVKKNNLPYGGGVVVTSGDKHQTCTIVEKTRSKKKILEATFLCSDKIDDFVVTELTIPVRDAEDPEYSKMCDLVGAQKLPNVDPKFNNNPDVSFIELPIKYSTKKQKIYDWVHPDPSNAEECSKCIVQCDFNADVDVGNLYFLSKVKGPIIELKGVERCKKDDFNEKYSNLPFNVTSTYLANWKEQGIPDHVIQVKTGCIVMCMRNIDTTIGLSNGSVMKILSVGRRVLRCKIMKNGKIVELPRLKFELKIKDVGCQIYRLQFPVKLCYCTSKHKGQGVTLKRTAIDNSKNAFSHGANYTSITRIPGFDKIRIFTPKSKVRGDKVILKNVVYAELINLKQKTVMFEKKDVVPEFIEAMLYLYVCTMKESNVFKIVCMINLFVIDERDDINVRIQDEITPEKLVSFIKNNPRLNAKYEVSLENISVKDAMNTQDDDIIKDNDPMEVDDKEKLKEEKIKEENENKIDIFIEFLNRKDEKKDEDDDDVEMVEVVETEEEEEDLANFSVEYLVLDCLRMNRVLILLEKDNLDDVLKKINEVLQKHKKDVFMDAKDFENFTMKYINKFNDYLVIAELNSICYCE